MSKKSISTPSGFVTSAARGLAHAKRAGDNKITVPRLVRPVSRTAPVRRTVRAMPPDHERTGLHAAWKQRLINQLRHMDGLVIEGYARGEHHADLLLVSPYGVAIVDILFGRHIWERAVEMADEIEKFLASKGVHLHVFRILGFDYAEMEELRCNPTRWDWIGYLDDLQINNLLALRHNALLDEGQMKDIADLLIKGETD